MQQLLLEIGATPEYPVFKDMLNYFGTPIVVLVGVYLLLRQALPKLFEFWKEKDDILHAYYESRQHQFDEQMLIMNRMMEQGNAALGQSTAALNQSTAVIERNNVIIGQQSLMNEKIIAALDKDLHATTIVYDLLDRHDKRSENINTDVVRITEFLKKTENKEAVNDV